MFIATPEGSNRCAVVGCENEGRAHNCPYDGGRHHHGRIHYDCERAKPTTLVFHQSDWNLICQPHYDHLVNEMRARGDAPEWEKRR